MTLWFSSRKEPLGELNDHDWLKSSQMVVRALFTWIIKMVMTVWLVSRFLVCRWLPVGQTGWNPPALEYLHSTQVSERREPGNIPTKCSILSWIFILSTLTSYGTVHLIREILSFRKARSADKLRNKDCFLLNGTDTVPFDSFDTVIINKIDAFGFYWVPFFWNMCCLMKSVDSSVREAGHCSRKGMAQACVQIPIFHDRLDALFFFLISLASWFPYL